MYTVMIVVRLMFKTIKLLKSMWNVIKDVMIYIKSRIITSNENDEETIIFFKNVNDVSLNISNLRALSCRTYTHVFKIFNRHKLNDRYWKSIHVDYDKNN